jgi:hypothetical protein
MNEHSLPPKKAGTVPPPLTAALFAVIELFGHARVAGEITESPLGGGALIRVTVPECNGRPAHTRDVNSKAIYAITYCDREAMLACDANPVIALIGEAVREKLEAEMRERMEKRFALQSLPDSQPDDTDTDEEEDDLPL